MPDESLTSFVSNVCDQSYLRVETDLGDGFVRLRSEEAQRRQAVHDIRSTEDALIELLRNARDAHARNIFVATNKVGNLRSLVVLDDGDGIPRNMQELIFEPRVTSKLDSMHIDRWGVHGRGMALYAVKMNAEDARVVKSAPQKGTSIIASFNVLKIREKTDQSTFPAYSLKDGSTVSVRGPKNLIRTACEFALEHRDVVNVFMGSFSEIAAALYAYGKATVSIIDRTFARNTDEIPLIKQLSLSSDEETFCEIASSLGLSMSTRTARRIMGGEIVGTPTLIERIQILLAVAMSPKPQGKHSARCKVRDASSVRIPKESLVEFSNEIKETYASLAESLYLDSEVEPSVRVINSELVVKIPLVPQQ